MNFFELELIIKHVRKNNTCPHCDKRYNIKDISVLASTQQECLLELKCQYCKKTALTDIIASSKAPKDVPLINQMIKNGITDNDILDVKNFLESFDGDFKKLFHN
ncbi:hypothetical protein HOG17_01710 [Candidatus Peregrinibacteria bacterium]|jgi:hypothetical protein|nr:hypothetical protein [Candidatus Peregrinibacteria bacterium]MBT4148074.1 hypothetical protein [Candidatus Peregrinibacteria bacterium]MBT4366605.1 hypothetical protein [Candidatus Peregrinibacteria bacterium]MBT4456472.1 hypothetical protein [Candidatus Peregrinibacteria bacterium]